jgi:ADP-ribose diphosphatase
MGQKLCGDQWISLYRNDQDITYVQMDDAALVVPLTADGQVLFITEPSPAYGERVLTLPAGNVETGETPAIAANRELQEEIGYRAARLDALGQLYPFVKYLRCCQHIFLARDLAPSRLQGDEGSDWIIEVEPTPLLHFERLIDTGRLRDSTAIAALYRARRYLEREITA